MSDTPRERVEKLMRLALKNPNVEEARSAAMKAVELIDRHKLLDAAPPFVPTPPVVPSPSDIEEAGRQYMWQRNARADRWTRPRAADRWDYDFARDEFVRRTDGVAVTRAQIDARPYRRKPDETEDDFLDRVWRLEEQRRATSSFGSTLTWEKLRAAMGMK